MKNDIIRQRIYLAALLSDIGRFYFRGKSDDEVLSPEFASLNDSNQPEYIPWSCQFINKYLSSKLDIGDNNDQNSVIRYIRDSYKETSIIRKAERWAVGNIELKEERNNKVPLKSIFSICTINGHEADKKLYIQPKQLDIIEFDNMSFNRSLEEIDNNYKTLWKNFIKEVPLLPDGNIEAFTESLLHLLKKYLWCVPISNVNGKNDFIDLYNHAKTKACITDCLYKTEDITNKLIIVGGDVSSIQTYIYNIASRKAAVSLKGRSFFIQLLVDSIIQRIIQHNEIDASFGHVLYSSGGKFYMLLPNTNGIRQALDDEIKVELEKYLWNELDGQISVNLSYIPFNLSDNDLFDGYGSKISDLWKKLNDNFTELKHQKFRSVVSDPKYFGELFTPQPIDVNSKVCAVTGIEGYCVALNDNDEKTYVLPSVKEQSDLGKTLKDADYILSHNGKATNLSSGGTRKNIDIFGIANYIFDERELYKREAELYSINANDTTFVKRINNNASLKNKLKGNNVCYGFQFYGGNNQAWNNDKERPKTFDELASDTYLGVLRMDVDNLGNLFIQGVKDADRSFSSNATLSFLFDYFFSGYLNTIREKDIYRDCVNILYSGGDDVFAVGRWDSLISFAEEVRNEFRRFVGRDDISISGGISIVGQKFPIAKSAQMAGEAERRAKEYRDNQKNALSMFGEVVSWNEEIPDFTNFSTDDLLEWVTSNYKSCSEYAFVKANKMILYQLISDKVITKSLLHKLMLWHFERTEGNLSYYWHTAYYLNRFVERRKEYNDIIKIFFRTTMVNILYSSGFDKRDKSDYYRLMAVAARWAELELRFNEHN